MNNRDLIKRFKDYFRSLHQSDLSHLRRIYADDLVFRDPLHELRGLVQLEDYYTSMRAELADCRYEYLDELMTDNSAYLKWMLHYKHSGPGNRLNSVRGICHLKLGDKVEFQEDFYDMSAMRYPQSPRLGNVVTRWFRARFAG